MIKDEVAFSDFQKLDLRVGRVVSADKVEGSINLLRLEVDLGQDCGVRKILSGIAKWYQPKALTGKKFIFVVNLEPKKMMGEDSQGMILALDTLDKAVVIPINKRIPEGTVVR